MRDELRPQSSPAGSVVAQEKVFIAGATGAVGRQLTARLVGAGGLVRCGSLSHRAEQWRGLEWVPVRPTRPSTLRAALEGCTSAVYIDHEIEVEDGGERARSRAATAFAEAVLESNLERIVLLESTTSATRGAATAHALGEGTVPIFDLQVAMVIGAGATDFQIVRDLAMGLPFMVLPNWMRSRSCPIALDDVVDAIVASLKLPLPYAGTYELPGPELLSAKELVLRTAGLLGRHPRTVDVPFATPRLSTFWLTLATSASYATAQDLVAGLADDHLPSRRSLWRVLPRRALRSVEQASRSALNLPASRD